MRSRITVYDRSCVCIYIYIYIYIKLVFLHDIVFLIGDLRDRVGLVGDGNGKCKAPKA